MTDTHSRAPGRRAAAPSPARPRTPTPTRPRTGTRRTTGGSSSSAARRAATCQLYPRDRCLVCRGPVEWVEASGRGTVYSFTVIRQNYSAPLPGLDPLRGGPRRPGGRPPGHDQHRGTASPTTCAWGWRSEATLRGRVRRGRNRPVRSSSSLRWGRGRCTGLPKPGGHGIVREAPRSGVRPFAGAPAGRARAERSHDVRQAQLPRTAQRHRRQRGPCAPVPPGVDRQHAPTPTSARPAHVAWREGEHGMSFAKRVNELGYTLRDRGRPRPADADGGGRLGPERPREDGVLRPAPPRRGPGGLRQHLPGPLHRHRDGRAPRAATSPRSSTPPAC